MKFIDLYNIILQNRLDDYKLQLKDNQLAQSIFNINDPKKEKMIIKWIKNNSIKYPQQKELIDKAYEIINRKGLDYNKFNSPQQILNQYQFINNKLQYNPDNQKCFTNKVQLGNGVVVYDVYDDIRGGREAVRKAVDYNWGKEANPWCIVAKDEDGNWSEGSYWNTYSAIPKRIAFKDGKLIAMCANKNFNKIQWWDRKDQPKSFKEITGVQDDPKAIQKANQFSKNKINDIFFRIKNDRPVVRDYVENIALHENLTEEQFNLLYKFDFSLRNKLIKNPNCPSELLFKICRGSNVNEFRILCLKHPNFPKDKLEHYANNPYLIKGIIQNPNCPKQILEKTYKHSNILIKKIIAENPNCPIQLLQKLSKEDELTIRFAVYKNPNCPKQIFQNLINLANRNDYTAVSDLLHLDICPKQILEQYSTNKDDYLRSLVASNPKTPTNILKILSQDHIYDVCSPARKQIMHRFEVVYPR